MVLRKITIDNSVRYIPKSEKNPTKIKKQCEKINLFQEEVNQTGETKTKKIQKIIKNLLKILQQEDLQYLNE